MIIIEGTIRVADLVRAWAHMEAMIEASRGEDGCIDYSYAADLMEPGLIRVIERWESRDAFAAHLRTDHIARWRAAWPDIGVTDRNLRLYEAEPETV